MSPINILIMDHFDILGGAQLYLLDMVATLQGHGFEFRRTEVLDGWSQSRLDELAVPAIARFPYFSKRHGLRGLMRSTRDLHQLKREAGAIDLVLSNSMPGLLAGRLAFGPGMPIVHIAHRMDYGPALRWMLRHWPHRLVTVSRTAADWFQRIGVEPGRIRIVPNGFDPSEYTKTSSNPDPATLCLGMVGRLDKEKGIDDVLELALAIVHGGNVRIRLVGASSDPGAGDLLVSRVRNNGLSDVIEFAGRQPPGQDLFRGIDVLLNLSHFQETFGRSYVEAALLGIPTVSYRNGAPEEWIRHGRNGWFVESVIELIELVRLLAGDRARVKEAGQAARMTVLSNFTLQDCATRLGSVIRECLGSR